MIFEKNQYDLQKAISDIAGQDVHFHKNEFEIMMEKARNFFCIEAGYPAPGLSRLISEYATFQGWMMEKKLYEGHSKDEAIRLPSKERFDEMRNWTNLNRPISFQ